MMIASLPVAWIIASSTPLRLVRRPVVVGEDGAGRPILGCFEQQGLAARYRPGGGGLGSVGCGLRRGSRRNLAQPSLAFGRVRRLRGRLGGSRRRNRIGLIGGAEPRVGLAAW